MAESEILLASPREPSGASWLINCLLELGVRVDIKPAVDRAWQSVGDVGTASMMWRPAPNGGWRLHPRAGTLRKWLPCLSVRDIFNFREDVTALYVQELPRTEFTGARTALFVRDPRDAIPSSYHRIRPDMTLPQFVHFLHPETLLDAIAHWRLFVECWLARTGILVYRFEDYKTDAVGLLTRIVRDLDIEASPEAIARAASESTYEKARQAEGQYLAMHPGDVEVAMRASRVGEWKSSQESLDLSRAIEERTAALLIRLGYEVKTNDHQSCEREGTSQLRFLSRLEHIDVAPLLREAAASSDPLTCPLLPDVLKFASTIDAGVIRRAKLQVREARMLLDNLQEYAAAWQGHQRLKMAAVRAEFRDGSTYHLTRIREFMTQVKMRRRVPERSSERREPNGPQREQTEEESS